MKIDLHSHTNCSDGTLSPQELVDFMEERGVELFSISDHDTVAAYGNFVPYAGSRFIPSIEINTTWRKNEVHVLGYGVPTGPSPITELLEYNQVQRRIRAETMVKQLQEAGYPIPLEVVLHEAGSADAVGRPHVAKALVRLGIAQSVDDAFKRMIGGGDAATDWNLVMATAMLAMLPPALVVLLMQKWFVKGLVDAEK